MARSVRKSVNVDKLADMTDLPQDSSAIVKAFVTKISPTRDSKTGNKRYFTAELQDGSPTKVRCVGFKASQQAKLSAGYSSQYLVKLTDCTVKRGRFPGDDMQLLLGDATAIGQASDDDNDYDPDTVTFANTTQQVTPTAITLDQIDSTHPGQSFALRMCLCAFQNASACTGQRVSLRVKVTSVTATQTVGAKKWKKQDVIIADATGCSRITLWQDKIGLLQLNKTYRLANILVTSFNRCLQLTIPREGSDIDEDTISLETVSSNPINDATQTLPDTSIAAVNGLTHYRACINCKRRVAPTDADATAEEPEPVTTSCSHCHTKQRYAECPHRHAGTLLLSSPGAPDTFLKLNAYDSVLRDITQKKDISALITDDILLASPSFTAVYSPERQQLLAVTRE